MELMYDLQKPFSVFDVIPQSPPLKHLDDLSAYTSAGEFEELSRDFFSGGGIVSSNGGMMSYNNNKRNRVMTAPSALFHGQQPQAPSAFCAPFSTTTFNTPPPWSPFTTSPIATTTTSSVTTTATTPRGYFYTESPTSVYNPSSTVSTPFDGYPTSDHHNNKEMMLPSTAPAMTIPPPLPPVTSTSNCLYNNNNNNINSNTLTTITSMPPPPLVYHNPKKRAREPTSEGIQQPLPQQHSTPTALGKRISIRTSDDAEPQIIELQEFTSHELKVKLCTVLSLHPDQVSHIVWRPKEKSTTFNNNNNDNNSNNNTSSPRKKSNSQEIFITMDDDFITQDLLSWQQPSATWEIKSDGTVRIILEN